MGQMQVRPVEVIGEERAAGASRLPAGLEHEVIGDELAAPVEQLGQGLAAALGLEHVVLVDPHPRQGAPRRGDLVAPAHMRLFLRQQCLRASIHSSRLTIFAITLFSILGLRLLLT
jgi:hypothetical protein